MVCIWKRRDTEAGDMQGEHHVKIMGRTDAVMNQGTLRLLVTT